jgi:hypothetical protein
MVAIMIDRPELRLQILIILFLSAGYEANQEVLIRELKKRGVILTRDQLKIELAWLDEQADVIVDRDVGGVHVALLNGDGLEHVEGSRVVPGIRRPRPDEMVQ